MATLARPAGDQGDGYRMPNIASADVQLPAVRDYEQVDNEITSTMHPTAGWFMALGAAILCMLIGASAWAYQIYWGTPDNSWNDEENKRQFELIVALFKPDKD